MNATNYYVSTTRLVMQADPDNPSTWQDLYRMLPTLRNSLSCTVCEHLLIEPYTPEETSCEHHVCKGCKGGLKKLRPTCSWCKDYSKYNENVQLRILIQNYKKLCGLVKITQMYGHILSNGEQGKILRDIIRESEGERIKPMRVENIRSDSESLGKEVEIKRETDESVSEDEYCEMPCEQVEEEIVGECEVVSLGCMVGEDLRGSDEPPDEIISSPLSKMKMKVKRDELQGNPLTATVRVCLNGSFDQEHLSTMEDSRVSIKREPQSDAENISSLPSRSSPLLKSEQSSNKAFNAKRKIKAEAFILDPSKSKTDLPIFRKLDSAPKVITVVGTSA